MKERSAPMLNNGNPGPVSRCQDYRRRHRDLGNDWKVIIVIYFLVVSKLAP